MGRKKILIGSILAVALLTLVSFSNVVGYNTIKTSQEELMESKYSFDECKEYLFETLVEISDNPDIKDIIKSNYKPQRTILPFRMNNVELKVEHLELLYKMGLKLIDRLGEERVEDLLENIEIPEFAEELDAFVMGNDELRERIYTLNEMNVKSDKLDRDFPIICGILIALFFIIYAFYISFYISLSIMFGLGPILQIIYLIFCIIYTPIDKMLLFFDCFPSPWFV